MDTTTQATDTTEDLLESAKQALIADARTTYRNMLNTDAADGRDAARQVAYGRALGTQEALAAFLAATELVDEDHDPTDMARAYAEGRDPGEDLLAELDRLSPDYQNEPEGAPNA